VSDKTCSKCRYWQERNLTSGICVLNPRVWAGTWQYPTQFAIDTCSHHTAAVQLAPVVKRKQKSAA